jgi:hypothetical protein
MSDPIVACVRTGGVYDFEYVIKLRNMVARHMRGAYAFACLTDQAERCEGAQFIDIAAMGLGGWWGKMALFEEAWRGQSQIIYFDLDTVILNDITPLTGVVDEFAILTSPVRAHGNVSYPCKYNSSCMVIGDGRCGFVWRQFDRVRDKVIAEHATYGDQKAIETLYGSDAAILQSLMPKGFFENYRTLTMHKSKASVVNFGGSHKPHNCPIHWVREAWV